jgi:hypothetical protein
MLLLAVRIPLVEGVVMEQQPVRQVGMAFTLGMAAAAAPPVFQGVPVALVVTLVVVVVVLALVVGR